MGYWHTVFAVGMAVLVATTGFGHGVAAEPIDDGLAAFQSEDYARALEVLLPLAEAGNLDASHTVGVIYGFGRGVNQDEYDCRDLVSDRRRTGDGGSPIGHGYVVRFR